MSVKSNTATLEKNSSGRQDSCPSCKENLKIHSNEQLQQCAFNELSKINRKSIAFDQDAKSQSNANRRIGGSNVG